jgi:hypothetical protein
LPLLVLSLLLLLLLLLALLLILLLLLLLLMLLLLLLLLCYHCCCCCGDGDEKLYNATMSYFLLSLLLLLGIIPGSPVRTPDIAFSTTLRLMFRVMDMVSSFSNHASCCFAWSSFRRGLENEAFESA